MVMDTNRIARIPRLQARASVPVGCDRRFAQHADRGLRIFRTRTGPKPRASIERVDVLQNADLAAHAGLGGVHDTDEGAVARRLSRVIAYRSRDLNDDHGVRKYQPVRLPTPDPATGPGTAIAWAEPCEPLKTLDGLAVDDQRVILLRNVEQLDAEATGRLVRRFAGAVRKQAGRLRAGRAEPRLEPRTGDAVTRFEDLIDAHLAGRPGDVPEASSPRHDRGLERRGLR